MTTAPPTPDVATRRALATSVMPQLAGWALVAGPVVFLAGLLTSPPGDTTDPRSSITAFATHPVQTQLSGLLLHYGLIAMSFGLLAVPTLVRGRRGAALSIVGSLMTAIGMINVSGGLRDDWWRTAAGQTLPVSRAEQLVSTADSSSLLVLWDGTEMFAFLGVMLVLAALGRAGALSWAWLGVAVVMFGATMVVPGQLQVWPNIVFGAFIATLVPVGARQLRATRDA